MRHIDTIIIHYTASFDCSAKTIDLWHRARGWSGIAYHKVIRKNGAIEAGRAESRTGGHCKGHNTGSLGVVLTGSNLMRWYPAQAQYNSLVKVIKEWQRKYPIKYIYFHKELDKTSCPGRLDKDKILSMLKGESVMDSRQETLVYKWFKMVQEEVIRRRKATEADIKRLEEKINIGGLDVDEVVKAIGKKLSE